MLFTNGKQSKFKLMTNHSINKDYSFIHIGKCGGTYVRKFIQQKKNIKYYHLKRNYAKNEKIILWIRNPLNRFVSAFYYVKNIINQSIDSVNPNNLTLKNCLSPHATKCKIKNGYAFSKRYEFLINSFDSVNELAESLSQNHPKFALANELMHLEIEHIYKGIGWYLYDGDFINKNYKNIFFIGSQEHMTEDIIRLSNKMNITINKIPTKIRENKNKNNKFLSSIAIQNLLEFYKDTDYKALQTMLDHKLITKELFDSYYKYNQ